MRCVVDVSIALKWVIPEAASDTAAALLAEELIAPSLWLVEAANGLWRHVRLGEMTAAHAVARFADLATAPVTSIRIGAHVERALKLAMEARHPVYDCLYLGVALHYQTHVVTADRQFVAAAARAGHADRVRLLTAAGHRSLHEP